MAEPTTREEFKQYCLRRLGKPVVKINVDDEQLEDRIDDALEYYQKYHYSGSDRFLLTHQITSTDITNKYITLGNEYTGVVQVFDIGDSTRSSNLFDIRYQLHLNDLFNYSAGNLTPYVQAKQYIETLEEVFVGKKPIQFNEHSHRLYIYMDWSADVTAGDYIIIDCYKKLDPSSFSDIWRDRWLQQYATALIKKQWGENMKKFEGMQLPGGLTFNGQKVWEEADTEINKLEEDMINSYSGVVSDFIG